MGKDDETKNNDSKPQEFIVDTQSPYFLYPLDSPGTILTIVRFNWKNYVMWEQVVRTALKAKNKLAFIDGKIIKPVIKDGFYSAEANAWEMVNSMVKSWIMNVINPKLHLSVAYVDSAQRMWDNIQKRYFVPNVPRIHQLKAAIALSKQEGSDVVDFFWKLMSLWNELENYMKLLLNGKFTHFTCLFHPLLTRIIT